MIEPLKEKSTFTQDDDESQEDLANTATDPKATNEDIDVAVPQVQGVEASHESESSEPPVAPDEPSLTTEPNVSETVTTTVVEDVVIDKIDELKIEPSSSMDFVIDSPAQDTVSQACLSLRSEGT